MSLEEIAECKQQLQQHKGRIPPKDTLRQLLKLTREARVKNPEDVATYGSMLIQHYKSKLAEEELWLLHEQVGIALLECGNLAAALPLIKAVLIKFPDSVRARRLQGMFYEARGNLDQAKQLYETILKEQPHNEVIPKQLATLYRGSGQLSSAIDTLRIYLDHYMNDREAWEELAECYMEASMYRQAAFCMEEVLSTAPLSPLVLIRYADLLATIGGVSHLRTARAYYSKALQVSGGRSVRALYGLIAVANQLPDKDAAASAAAGQELPKAAAEALLDLYSSEAPDKLPIVMRALQRYL